MKRLFTFLIIFLPALLHATATMWCNWHAAYFDAEFVANYGSEMDNVYIIDVTTRAQVVMQLDSIFRDLKRKGELPSFKRWFLFDSYMKSLDAAALKISGDTVYVSLTDSLSVNQLLQKIWHVKDIIVSTNKKSGMWLYSLHVKCTKSRWRARNYPSNVTYSVGEETDLLWLEIDGGWSGSHCFYQYEIDGYFHQYLGLFLTTKNVLEAQKYLLDQHGLKTTITSQYVTPAILAKYVMY